MNTLLLIALSKKNFTLVLSLLKKIPPHLLKETDEDGKTIAHHFAAEGLLEGLQYLASDTLTERLLRAKDNQGCTPFITAALSNQPHIVNYFIANQYDNFSSKAHAAAFFGYLDEIKALNESDWKARDTFNTHPPKYAIAAGQTEVLKFLSEKDVSLMPLNYPELFTTALNLKQEETALFLLKKINHEGFVKEISTLIKVLAKNPDTSIEILNKIERTIDGIIPFEYKLNYYPFFIAGAVIHNDLTIFTYFLQKFLKDKMYLSGLEKLQDICTFISKHREFQFARVLAEKLLPESLDLVAACCCYLIENNDDISLDIFLKTAKKFNECSINYLARQNAQFHLFYYALKKQTPAIIVILRRCFTNNYFLENYRFFASTENFMGFLQDYLLNGTHKYINDTLEHNQFTEAVDYILSLPENPVEYYEIASKNLRLCCQKPLAHKNLFAQKTLYLLNEIIDTYILAQKPDWPLFKHIYSDIKYLTLEANLPIEISDLSNLLKLAFVFSDYQTANKILNKLLSNNPDNQEILTLNKINFFIVKIYALLLSEIPETDFSLSDDIKNLLLEEHKSFGSISPNFMSDFALLMLLPKMQLTPKTSQGLRKKLEKITPKKINACISIKPLILKPKMGVIFFQSLRLLHDTLYQLKEWSDNITAKREAPHSADQTDVDTIKQHLIILGAYENCCRVKIFLCKAILELINLLASSKEKTEILLSEDINISEKEFEEKVKNLYSQTDVLLLHKWIEKKDWSDKAFYQDSLIHAESDLAQLKGARLIAQEQLEQLTKKNTNNHKTNKLPQKNEKKPTFVPTNTRPPAKIAESVVKIYPSKIVISDENDSDEDDAQIENDSQWHKTYSRNQTRRHNRKKQPFFQQQASKPPIQKTVNAKNNLVIPIARHQNAKSDENAEPCILKPNKYQRKTLEKYLFDNQNNIKIFPNSLLAELGFAINVPQKVKKFFKHFQPNQIFLDGGAVRNSLGGEPVNDFDFIVLLSAEKIKEMFPQCEEKGKRKKILTLYYDKYKFDILPIECTSYQEALMRDQFDDEKIVATLKFDSEHRDLTFNAFYWNPYKGLIDLYGGMADLLVKRMINPIQPGSKPFEVQNAVRILRVVRFAAQFHLTISKDLRRTMLSNIFFLYTVHIDNIQAEYQSLIKAVGEVQAIQLYQHYFVYDLISKRIPLKTLTWSDFWSSDMKSPAWIESSQELRPIRKGIKSYLSEKDLRALQCISKNPFTFFQPAKAQTMDSAGVYLRADGGANNLSKTVYNAEKM